MVPGDGADPGLRNEQALVEGDREPVRHPRHEVPGGDVQPLALDDPGVEELGNDLLSRYSGSSFAAACVTGNLLLLASNTGRSVHDCYKALIQTANEKRIRPGKAYDDLQ